ncbi:TPA: IS200/IS605 family element transposase accessory protein TnpB [Candidatus Bathyarchaeota archaeon]|nr:IS200/IS605 family element transposase accessory protein TnpB [Candidatus Bathyarchaeota archaeon]
MKAEKPELNTVFSQVLQNICKRIRRGFENCWARRRHGLKAGLPHFRDRHQYRSLTYPQMGFSLKDGWLKLSKIGTLRMVYHRPIEGRIKTLTIKRTPTGKWYATFCCEVESKPISGRKKAVGVDFGLVHLVALSDGTIFEAPKTYRKIEAQSRKAHRFLSHKKKGSRNREKARVRLVKVEEKAKNRRRDFAFKIARSIVDRYQKVVVEDLRIDNMRRNRCLSKSIGDAGWGILRSALTYMAQRSEGVMVLVDPSYTSQLCSGCGKLVSKSLSERTHRCSVCGLVLDRDVNAAQVILRRGIGVEYAESKPVDGVATAPLFPGCKLPL